MLTQTAGVLFHLAFLCGACSGALPRLFPFLRGSLFDQLLFSLSWQQKSSTMTLKRREYHVDCRAKKAAIFFVTCEQNPATRVKIPNAIRIKGYSPSEATNQALQMQVHHEAEKIKGEAIPGPPAPAAVAKSALLSLASVATTARPGFEQSHLIQRLLMPLQRRSMWYQIKIRGEKLARCRTRGSASPTQR